MKQVYSTVSKMKSGSWILVFVIILFSFQKINAQAGAYAFASSTGATLTTMTGSTSLLGSGQDDISSGLATIPFTFTFACTGYTQFSVNSNGALGLGGTVVTSSLSNSIAGSSTYPIIMPFWDDMHTCTSGKVHYVVTGTTPNRILTVEWLFGNYGEASGVYKKTAQVRLYETTNVVEIVYGANSGAAGVGASVGIASSSSSYQSVTTSANTASNSSVNDANTVFPASGTKYTFTPGGTMAFTSCTTAAVATTTVNKCDVNKEVLGIQVVMNGSCTPMSLTQLQINMTGTTTVPGDASLIHIYYTGASGTFSASGAFDGAGTASAAGTITINGSQALVNGTNYFWIAYDINGAATTGDVVDAQCTQLTVAAVTHVPTATTAAGTRSIVVCPPAPGGISSGIVMWLKAGAGVTTSGVNVTGWADQSAAATAVTVNGSPDLISAASGYNNNPYINFTLSNAGSTGGDYLHTADLNLRSFFCVAKLNDLTRKSTHIVTYDQVTFAAPCGLCAIHGGENGTAAAEYGETTYGNSNFQTAGVWRKNGDGTGVLNTTAHTGKFDIVSALGTGTGSVNSYFGGQVDNVPTGFNGRMRDWYGPVGEFIAYTGAITAAQANKIESYLAIKYGITLGGNGSTTVAYNNTSGTVTWTANSGYHYDVTGIGAESVEGLQQNISKNIIYPAVLGSTDMPFRIAHDLITAPTNVSDGTYIIVGHNNGVLSGGGAVAYTHGGDAIQIVQTRLFRIQTTALAGGHSMMAMTNLEIEFDMSKVPGIGGAFGLGVGVNDPTKLRLLLDDNTTFGQGTAYEKSYSNSGVTGNVIKFLIPVADLPANGVMFFRIGSIDKTNAPLPVELTSFSANCSDNKVNVKWTTASEVNNDHFNIDRTQDGVNFERVAAIAGAGSTSETHHYSWSDMQPFAEQSYYRLSQTDFDGTTKFFNTISVNCNEENNTGLQIVSVGMNSNQLTFSFSTSYNGGHLITVYDMQGRLITGENKNVQAGVASENISVENLSEGVYILRIENAEGSTYKKVMFVK